jgi:choline-sulfatase
MLLRVRLVSAVVGRVASVGIAAGLVFAAAEIITQRYLPYHLWRTALHAAAYDTLLAGAVGAAAGLLMWLSLVASAARARARGVPAGVEPPFAVGLATSFAVIAAAAILLMPARAPLIFGLSHWVFFGAGVALIWTVVAGAAADPPAEGDGLRSRVALTWPALVAVAYLVALAHLWTSSWSGWIATAAASAGILAALGLASLLSRPAAWVAGRLRRPRPSASRWAPIALIVVTALLWSASSLVGRATRAHPAGTGMNVLIIAVDTLRYDAVSLRARDEHERDLTPELRKRFAPRATIFTRAYSASAWTLPSFASMFTGLYPEQHHAESVWSTLAPGQLTLAELLRERGYATRAVVSGHFVTREVGMAQGFSRFDEHMALSGKFVTSAGVTDRALRFLQRRDKQPFFLFVHYFDPHFPYMEHREAMPALRRQGTTRVAGAGEGPSQGRFAYAGEVAYTDRHIGRLLRFVDEHQLWKNTCVVFVADHGEEFFEHGSNLHARTLYEEIIHVPLAIAVPGADPPRLVSEPVGTRRLFHTLLHIAGVPAPAGAAAEPSLLAPEGHETVPIYSVTCARGRTDGGATSGQTWLSSLTGDRYKVIEDRLHGGTMVFDLQADPGEQHDLSQERRELSAPLARALTAMEARLSTGESPASAPHLTRQEQRQLKALGYL